MVACAALFAVIGRFSATPPETQRPADREASTFADGYLLTQLTTAAENTTAEGDAVTRVEDLLQSMTGERVVGSYETILVGSRHGQSFPVAVYSYWEDKSFSAGTPYYGRACRIYTVDGRTVTSKTLDCPTSVPDQPSVRTLSNAGWFAG